MDTQRARDITAAHDAQDRSVANLRNAVAMSADDPRATQLLEEAGDAYAVSTKRLLELQVDTIETIDAAALAAEQAATGPVGSGEGPTGVPGPSGPSGAADGASGPQGGSQATA